MSDVKHTAGPWMAAASGSSVVGWPVVGPMGRSICSVSWLPKKAYPDVSVVGYAAFNSECEANARLIAAAPDLLAALKRQQANISRWRETGAPATPEESKSISGQIDAAIAKAEGWAP